MALVARKGGFKWSKFFTSWYHPFVMYAIILTVFFLLRLSGGNEPILLKLGPFTFRWYGVIITTGVVIASFLAQFLAEHRGDNPDHVWRLLPILLVSGIATARLWYVAFTWDSYKDYIFSVSNPDHAGVIEIWRGGIAIQGAVIGGTVGALIYGYFVNRSQKRVGPRFSIWRFADYVAPGLVLAQGMGRWGNFMNNEAYGRTTGLPWGIKIPCQYRTTGLTPGTNDTRCPIQFYPNGGSPNPSNPGPDALFHPTFLYESLWDYLCFSVLFWMIMKPKTFERIFRFKLRDGDIILAYWIVYSIGRFFTESLRTDSLYLNGSLSGLRSAQVTAIAGILIAGFVMFFRHRQSFPAQQALSVRLAPVASSPVSVGSEGSTETVAKPDYKARVRPATAVADSSTEAEPEEEALPNEPTATLENEQNEELANGEAAGTNMEAVETPVASVEEPSSEVESETVSLVEPKEVTIEASNMQDSGEKLEPVNATVKKPENSVNRPTKPANTGRRSNKKSGR